MSVIPTLPIVNVRVGPGYGPKTIQLPAVSTTNIDSFLIRDYLGNCSPLLTDQITVSTTGLDTFDSGTGFILSSPYQSLKVLRNPPTRWSVQQDSITATPAFQFANFQNNSSFVSQYLYLDNFTFSTTGIALTSNFVGYLVTSNTYPNRTFQTTFEFTLSNYDVGGLSNYGLCFFVESGDTPPFTGNQAYIGYGYNGWSNQDIGATQFDNSFALRMTLYPSQGVAAVPLSNSTANNAFFRTRGNALIQINGNSNIVAVGEDIGQGSYRYISSSSALTGTWNSNSVPNMSSLNDLAYNNSIVPEQYVVVGTGVNSNYGIQTTPSIVNPSWTIQGLTGFSIRGNGVAINELYTRIVAVGEGLSPFSGYGSNTIIFGDGATPTDWKSVPFSNGAFSDAGYGVAYAQPVFPATNGTFVAVGKDASGNTIKYTSDPNPSIGIWSNATGGFDIAGRGILNNATSGFWIATGEDTNILRTIKYSGDGSNFSNINTGGFNVSGYSVTFGNTGAPSFTNRWVAVGAHTSTVTGLGSIQWSDDASNWYPANSGFSTAGYGVAFIGTKFIAVGDDASGASIKYSTDGISWTDSTSGYFPQKGYGIQFNGDLLAVGEGSNISSCVLQSLDMGVNWSPFITSGGYTVAARGIAAWSGRQFITAGEGIPTIQSFDIIGVPPVFSNFTRLNSPQFTGDAYAASFNSNVFSLYQTLVGGTDTTPKNTVKLWSGNDWISSSNAPFTSCRDIISVNNVPFGFYFHAVGYAAAASNTICSSSNGTNWIAANTGGFSTGGLGILYTNAVLAGLPFFIAVGEDANPLATIQYSGDGANWSNIQTGGFSIRGRSVTYDSRTSNYIAVGDDTDPLNTVQTSSDGCNWIPAPRAGYSVGTNGVLYYSPSGSPNTGNSFAVGQNSTQTDPYSPITSVKRVGLSGIDLCGKGIISSVNTSYGPLSNMDFNTGHPFQVNVQGAAGIVTYSIQDTITRSSFSANFSTFANAPFQSPPVIEIGAFSTILVQPTSYYGFSANSDGSNTRTAIQNWSLFTNS